MGTHDLDTLEGPFTYEALAPESINFVPLKDPEGVAHDGTRSYDAKTLLTGYQSHQQLRAYVLFFSLDVDWDESAHIFRTNSRPHNLDRNKS